MYLKEIAKKFLLITILITFTISTLGIAYVNAADDLIEAHRNISVSNVKADDKFEVKYTITPKPIPVTSQDNNKQKDIVFVIDTSGSMDWIASENRNHHLGEKSRLDIMKNVTQNFIGKFNNNDKVRISLIEYNDDAKAKYGLTNINSNNINNLNSYIENLKANGSTNIGDGLRTAYYMIPNVIEEQDKYIILMTDGEAEAYSYDRKGGYYMDNEKDHRYKTTVWTYDLDGSIYPNPDYRKKSLEYAKKVASELIANSNDKSIINTFVIGFGTGADGDKNKQIADLAKGLYFQAQDEKTVNEIYDKIQKIIETNVNGIVHFEENISSNLEVVEVKDKGLIQKFSINNNKLNIDVNNYYTLTGENYTSEPIEFTVKYKVKDNNSCKLGENGHTSFAKIDVLGKSDIKYLEEKIIDNLAPIQVNMKVSDSSGIINKEYDSTVNQLNYNVDNNGDVYKLYGQANITINFQGSDITHLRYKFVKIKEGQELDYDQWKYISVNTDLTTENDDRIFRGKDSVNFLQEPGKYMIKYEVVKQTGKEYGIKTSGSFGTFEIDERFGLNKSLSKNKIVKDEPINMIYTLNLNPIKLTDLYKVNSEEIKNITKPDTLLVEDIKLIDQLPSGLVDVSTSSSKIEKSLQQIEYKLDNSKGEYIPDKKEYTFEVSIKLVGDNVKFLKAGSVEYSDISLKDDYRISKKQEFTDIPQLDIQQNSEIIRHGIFNGTTVEESNEVNVVSNMNYIFGILLKADGINNSFAINIPSSISINDSMYMYEVDLNQNIKLNTKQYITAPEKNAVKDTSGNTIIKVTSQDGTGKIENGKEYIVVYSINNITNDSTITAKLDIGNGRALNLKVEELPDLF